MTSGDLARRSAPAAPAIRAVLFDLDGTLVHTRIDFPAMRRTILALLQDSGIETEDLTALDALSMISRGVARHEEPEALRSRAEEALVAIEVAACEGATEADGACETLQWLIDAGIRVGIVTRNSPQAVTRLLRDIPLPHEALLTRADTPEVKPHPIHLRLALQVLGVPAAEAMMVGDHPMDVIGGRAAGTRTLALVTPERSAEAFVQAAPDGLIRSLPELRLWISP